MSPADHAIWQADIEERQLYAEKLCAVHLSVNYDSDRAHGVYDDAPEGLQGEPR
jgi:hypothetical protein